MLAAGPKLQARQARQVLYLEDGQQLRHHLAVVVVADSACHLRFGDRQRLMKDKESILCC